MKAPAKASKLPLRLLLIYVLFICSAPTVMVWMDFDSVESAIEDWNWELGWSLILSIPLFICGLLAAINFRKIQILAAIFLLFASIHIFSTAEMYYSTGFDTRFDIDLSPLYFLRFALIVAIPFLLVYLFWRFWPWKRSAA